MSRLDLQASSGLVKQVRSLRRAIVQAMQAYHLHRRALHGALVRLERSAVKVARCVLRGLGEGDLAWLPGGARDWNPTFAFCCSASGLLTTEY